MLFYRAALPLSSRTLTFVSGIIRRHRISIGSAWRKLNPGQQALVVLVYLRKGETFGELAAGFGVGVTTAWRYVNETIALLAARAPRLRTAVRDAKKAGHAYVVVDGTLIPIDRVAADRPFYSGKHQRHGMNPQVIASPHGDILWVSGALPGSVHDKKAEWIWGVLAELQAADLVTLADKGYQGSAYAKIPYRGKNKPESQKEANKAYAKLRSPGEPANAQLKTWHILRKPRCCRGAPGNSPRLFTSCRSARQTQDENGSMPEAALYRLPGSDSYGPREACAAPMPTRCGQRAAASL
jgi:DDE superfamily endonuclease/Helix-turn-helix of DDE superfamily endonuclease